jgi:hypothetical protein
MHPERNDEVDARELAVSLRADPRPRCPQLRACHEERLYPVQGYRVLADSPGMSLCANPGGPQTKGIHEPYALP